MKKFIILLFAILVSASHAIAQVWMITELSPMPQAISNNAVVQAKVNGAMNVFSFGGIDSTKIWSGISNKSFRYDVASDIWDTISALPDAQTKIAAAASNVKNKIYVIGGYTVLSNGNEISSNKVHIYDPDSNVYLPDGAPIPIPIDDHVQTVWRDSLIFIVTGWSNSTNRPDVQIYNPALDSWSVGTSVPNNNIYKSFGASGLIRGDTIYYYGGASLSGAFNAQNQLRMGVIDPADPTQITWSNPVTLTGEPGYRCAATYGNFSKLFWIGGSKITYNFNGIAYNGSGGVPPANRNLFIPTFNLSFWATLTDTLPMDLRGIAEIENSFSGVKRILAGGMEANQKVSRKTLLLEEKFTLGVEELGGLQLSVYPNPAQDLINLDISSFSKVEFTVQLFDVSGRVVGTFIIGNENHQIIIKNLKPGIYLIKGFNDKIHFKASFIKE